MPPTPKKVASARTRTPTDGKTGLFGFRANREIGRITHCHGVRFDRQPTGISFSRDGGGGVISLPALPAGKD
jgi:hypothetical protein